MARPDPAVVIAIETDPRFKSGRYRGFYIQHGLRSRQDMTLTFAEGKVTGWGSDPVGRFDVRGSYDLERGRATMSKQYPGAHRVDYDATAEVHNGLWGLWQIRGWFGDRGGFQLWPIDAKSEGREQELEADRPVVVREAVPVAAPAGVA